MASVRVGKRCGTCKRWKRFDEFFRNHTYTDGHQKHCKRCAKTYQEKWRRTEHGKRRIHAAQVKHRFGVTETEYTELLEGQNGKCAICDSVPKQRLAVDHQHENKKVRALLCKKCNLALGLFNEDIYLLQRAASYLRYHDRSF